MKTVKTLRHAGIAAAFMSGAPDTASSTTTKSNKKAASSTTTDATAVAKANVTIIGVSSAVTMPEKTSNRGSKGKYPYKTLEVGQSIAVKGCTAKSLNGTISVWNRKAKVQRIGTDGKPAFEQVEMKDANGNVVGTTNDTTKPIMDETKHFFASDCDASTDPEQADCRIWRDK